MKLHWFGGVFLLLGSATAAVKEATIRPIGLQVVWEETKEAFDGFSAFNQQDPLELKLLLDGGGRGLIEIDARGSRLDSFTDDTGADMDGEIGPFPKISKDGTIARFSVRGKKAPAEGAREVAAKGSLKVRTGTEVETIKADVIEAKKGGKIEVNEKLLLKLSKVGKPDWGDEPFGVEFTIERDIPEVAAIRFYDEKGAEIKATKGGSGRMGFMKKVTVTQEYRLERKVEKFRVEVDLWSDLEVIEVPFAVKVGVGGGK